MCISVLLSLSAMLGAPALESPLLPIPIAGQPGNPCGSSLPSGNPMGMGDPEFIAGVEGEPTLYVRFRVDCTPKDGSHQMMVIPLDAPLQPEHRYLRLELRMSKGTFYRLGVLPAGQAEPVYDGFWHTAGNVAYDGPWGTRAITPDDSWHDVEMDLDHAIIPFDRATQRIGAVCVEIYGQGSPFAAWGGAKGIVEGGLAEPALSALSIHPEANRPHLLPDREIPLLVGYEAHGREFITDLHNLGMGNFVWIPSHNYVMGLTPWNEDHTLWEDIATCVELGSHFWVSGHRGLGDSFRPGGFLSGGHGSGEWYKPSDYARIIEQGGDLFVGALGEEIDADLIQENQRPPFRARLPHIFSFTDERGGRLAFESEVKRWADRYHSYGVPFLATMCITHHHSGFRAGADYVAAELLEHLPTTELQLAYLRGGARQFDGQWGVWISPWYKGDVPCADKTLWPMPQAKLDGGHPAHMFRRALYLSYVSNARILVPQNTEELVARGEDGELKAVLWGEELQRFWTYAKDHAAPFEPVPLTALLMDEDNGWEPANLWGGARPVETVWSILPAERFREGSFRECLDAFLPGFMRTQEAVNKLHGDDFPGYFAATPLGPFDIVASDIGLDKLREYPFVVVAGGVDMTEYLLTVLKDYTREGGVLLINVMQMYDGPALHQAEDLLGARITPEIDPSAMIKRITEIPGMPDTDYPSPWFASVSVTPTTAQVLAVDYRDDRPAGTSPRPILLRHTFGQGAVYLSTPEYAVTGYTDKLEKIPFFTAFMRSMAKERAQVWVDAERPTVSWSAARQEKDMVILLVNHDAAPVKCSGFMLDPAPQGLQLDVGEGAFSSSATVAGQEFTVEVAGRDVALLRAPEASGPQPKG